MGRKSRPLPCQPGVPNKDFTVYESLVTRQVVTSCLSSPPRTITSTTYYLYSSNTQDTLFADSTGVQYYSNCLIEGAIDYIYGKASAWFGECTLSNNGNGGAITANSRESPDDPGYYVIDSSKVTSSVSGLTGKVYLGRPWRVLARVVYQRSELGDTIHPQGWTTMAEGATP